MATTHRAAKASTARLFHQYSDSHIPAPAAAMGMAGTEIPAPRRARVISHKATAMAAPMKMRKVALTVNNVAMTSPPSTTPTAAAIGRFRPDLAGPAGLGSSAGGGSSGGGGVSVPEVRSAFT